MKKWFIVTLIVLLFSVSVSSVQAYTNEEHGFSIDPPSGWTVDEELGEEMDTVIAFVEPEEMVFISIDVEPTDYTLEQFVSRLKESAPTEFENYKFVSDRNKVINNVDVYEQVFIFTVDDIDVKAKYVVLVEAKKYYLILYITTVTAYDEYLSAFDDSIETFKIEEKRGCIIATATYGSELSPEVKFLRGFRDNTVLSTFAGSQFMAVFNQFYYSFSPSVASTISSNEALRGIMRVILYPLIGILHLSSSVFSLLSFSPELAVVMTGLVASILIAIVYVMPCVLLFSFHKKFKPSMRAIRLTGLVWGSSIMSIVLAETLTSSVLMMASTGAFILATMCAITLTLTNVITRRYIKETP